METKKSFKQKIASVKKELTSIQKNSAVAFGNVRFKYADLHAIQEVINPLLEKEGLMITHQTKPKKNGDIILWTGIISVDDDEKMASSIVIPFASYRWHYEKSGPSSEKKQDAIGKRVGIPLFDIERKLGACITYYRRYNILMLLDIAVSDEVDVNGRSYPSQPQRKLDSNLIFEKVLHCKSQAECDKLTIGLSAEQKELYKDVTKIWYDYIRSKTAEETKRPPREAIEKWISTKKLTAKRQKEFAKLLKTIYDDN